MGQQETIGLHPDLEDYFDSKTRAIDHPLLRVSTWSPEAVLRANELYESKTRQLAEAIERQDWISYVVLHERAYRVEALIELIDEFELSGPELWPVVGWVWVDTEGVRWNLDTLRTIWGLDPRDRYLVMNEQERQFLCSLPEQVLIWRGVNHQDAVLSLSWTLDREKAVWFARRFADDGDPILLAQGRISRSDVLAYFSDRKEAEIVVLPENVREITVIEVDRRV